MDFTHIFKVFADYLEFLIIFFSFGDLRKWIIPDKISDVAVSFAIVGISLAYLIRKTSKYSNPLPSENNIMNVITHYTIPLYLIVIPIYSLFLHFMLTIFSKLFDNFTINSFHTTVSVGLLCTAALLPISQFLNIHIFIQLTNNMDNFKRKKLGYSTYAILVVSFLIFGILYYSHYMMLAHETSIFSIGLAIILGTVLLIIVAIPLLGIWEWIFEVNKTETNNEDN